jgi:hypothetical protein
LDMINLARILMIIGIILFILGGLIFMASRLGFPVGRLPGDIQIQTNGATCIFPLATMIVVSIILTILANLVIRFFR